MCSLWLLVSEMGRRAVSCFIALFLAVTVRAQLPALSNSWLQVISDYARNNVETGESGPQWAIASISRRVARGAEDMKPAILPVLVVPVPVESKKTPSEECQVSSDSKTLTKPSKLGNNEDQKPLTPYEQSTETNDVILDEESVFKIKPDQLTLPKLLSKGSPYTTPSYDFITEIDSTPVQPFQKVAPSKQLVERFREQKPNAPYEPPMKLSNFDLSERMPPPLPPNATQEYQESPAPLSKAPLRPLKARGRPRNPPRPRFDRPLVLKGLLTVPRADYSEPYTVWWDPASGGARIDYHGGSATTFRSIGNDKVYYVETHVERSGGRAVRRCAVGSRQPASPENKALPVLPTELDQFSFVGYVRSSRAEGELWRRVVAGGEGQLGASRGEALTTRHDLLVARVEDRTVPLWYTVSVNSSVLGPDSDGYHHKYFDVVEQQHTPALFKLDLDETCDSVEYLDASVPEQRARLEPMREFTLPSRDPRYDAKLREFIVEYTRSYQDDTEEAVRRNLLMQTDRFVSSGNRQGSTAELGVNFLSDRLDTEKEELVGVPPGASPPGAENFPLSQSKTSAEELPKEYDWRKLGGVTPVRHQGSCNSCWAFASTGAVEGALFRKTNKLVQLSEKYLVDCADTHGAHGCDNSWPSSAFDFIEDEGLPLHTNYLSYKPAVDTCKKANPVTRISGYVKVPPNNVNAMKIAIKDYAPTVVIIHATCKGVQNYKVGVLYDERCGKTKDEINHAVLAVGWGEENGVPHFILKNSWGADWAQEGGYLRVQGPANICGVLTNAAYPRLEEKDVVK